MWTLESWQRFLIVFGGGLLLFCLGILPILPRYREARKEDPTHPISYIGSALLGGAIMVWACIYYFSK